MSTKIKIMFTYLTSLCDLFSVKITDDFNNWFLSNPVNYATKLCNYTIEVNKEMTNISYNAISKWNSSKFWKEEWYFDKRIEQEAKEQDILRRQIQVLIDEYITKDYNISKLSDEDLIKIANELITKDFRYEFISDINAFEISRKREKYYKRQKARFLKRKRSSLINFREVFRKLYSFHFKNLDDEHELAYTNPRMIS